MLGDPCDGVGEGVGRATFGVGAGVGDGREGVGVGVARATFGVGAGAAWPYAAAVENKKRMIAS
jgi:hypothetical protein